MTPRDRPERPDRLTAADVARLCSVDLKTIHNWANKGKIPCTRTEGRHLRFRRLEIIDFLRLYSYAVPDSLRQARPRVVLADAEAGLAATKRALGKRFEIDAHAGVVEALVAVGARDPDALVIDASLGEEQGIDALACAVALHASSETRHVRLVVTSADEAPRDRAIAGGAAFVRKPVTPKLRELLEELTGLTR